MHEDTAKTLDVLAVVCLTKISQIGGVKTSNLLSHACSCFPKEVFHFDN